MAEANIYGSLSGISIVLIEFLMIIFILAASGVSWQVEHESVSLADAERSYVRETVAYKTVLKSKYKKIQSYVNQMYHIDDYGDFGRLPQFNFHYEYPVPVSFDNSPQIFLFVWASDRVTHTMRQCLHQDLKTNGRLMMILSLECTHLFSDLCYPAFKLCNRSMDYKMNIYKENRISALSVYIDDSGSDRLKLSGTLIQDRTASSVLEVLSVDDDRSYPLTLICNAMHITQSKTGKLRQKFFSVIGNPARIMVQPSHSRNVSVTLDFDILNVNASRSGVINNSDIELMSLSELNVSCAKGDRYGLSRETHKIVQTKWPTMADLSVEVNPLLIDDNLRLRVKVSIYVESEYNLGSYFCYTECLLLTNRGERIPGCHQHKYFSVVSPNWRYERLRCEQLTSYNIDSAIFSGASLKNHYIDENRTLLMNDCINVFAESNSKIIYLQNKNYKLALCICLCFFACVAFVCNSVITSAKKRSALNTAKYVLQLADNNEDRIMKYDVFLSYSSKDKDWVKSSLLEFIESKGFKVCFDERDFPYGCNLIEAIGQGVYESRRVIAVVSPDYLKSGWCMELEIVLSWTKILNKEAPFRSLLPIKYRDCKMPEHIKCLKYIDYTKVTAACVEGSVFVKLLSFLFPSYQWADVRETISEEQFFIELAAWLAEP